MRRQINFRLEENVIELIRSEAKRTGLSQARVVESWAPNGAGHDLPRSAGSPPGPPPTAAGGVGEAVPPPAGATARDPAASPKIIKTPEDAVEALAKRIHYGERRGSGSLAEARREAERRIGDDRPAA